MGMEYKNKNTGIKKLKMRTETNGRRSRTRLIVRVMRRKSKGEIKKKRKNRGNAKQQR